MIPGVGPVYAKRLTKIGVATIEDLLLHVPHRYEDYRNIVKVQDIKANDTVTILGTVEDIKNIYTKFGKKIQEATITDDTQSLKVIWFNQPYLIKNINIGDRLSLSGKVGWFSRKPALISPEYEHLIEGQATIHTGKLVPVYPETYGVSSKWIRNKVNQLFLSSINQITQEFLPRELLQTNKLVDYSTAVKYVHYPQTLEEAEIGKKRLCLNELLMLQLQAALRKNSWQKNRTRKSLKVDKKAVAEFIASLPFKLTASQEDVVNEILSDLEKDYPMNRLLEGDVGSGKTVVAAIAAFVAFLNGYQTVFMAPTQILALQHYQTLTSLFQNYKVRIKLLTSDTKRGDLGRSDIFIGTHALIHKKTDFDNVALVVIDEQHRFGVEQREHLIQKSGRRSLAPHVLTMTATPIPRTVALTLYGDLDLSTLTELPSGRQLITTWVVPPIKREGAYRWIESQVTSYKSQVFIICPLIEESEKETMKSVKAVTSEFETLSKIFSKRKLGLLHGRLKAAEKERVIDSFKRGEIDILVSTPVVEVGIDVGNATIMVVEGAERFGLAQLHQLRGRVGRGKKKSYCLLFGQTRSIKALSRLNAMTRPLSGFELAELDLKLRGPGEVFGTLQHGFPELKIASWSDLELIKLAKDIAENALANPQKFQQLHQLINFNTFNPN